MANQKTYKILERDPYLADFAGDIELRMRLYRETKKRLLGKEKKISSFANGNLYYGFHQEGDTWVYREWAPGADALALIGDFNGWDRQANPDWSMAPMSKCRSHLENRYLIGFRYIYIV